jgi:hypothetical protein
MVRRMAVAMAVLGAALLALPGAAGAGGFATLGVSSLPDGTRPGGTWRVTLTVLQHGRTPLDGVRPVVHIRSADGATTRSFAARPAGKPGVYRANVVFPRAGCWNSEIDDGFSQTHTFTPVRIGGPQAAAPAAAPSPQPAPAAPAPAAPAPRRDGGDLVAALAAAAAAGLAAAFGAAATMRRRRRPVAAPAVAPR